jgi:glutamyl-tRNA synthetase
LDESYVSQVLSLIQERARTLAEIPQLADFFFLDELRYDTGLFLKGKLDAKSATRAITIVSQKLEQAATWDAATLEGILRSLSTELNLPTGELFGLLRMAITGRTAAPPLFQTMAVLGREKCLKRFRMTLELLPACLN